MKTGDIVRIKSIPNSKDIIKSIGKSIDGNFGFIFLEKSNTPHWESELEIHPDQIKLINNYICINQSNLYETICNKT